MNGTPCDSGVGSTNGTVIKDRPSLEKRELSGVGDEAASGSAAGLRANPFAKEMYIDEDHYLYNVQGASLADPALGSSFGSQNSVTLSSPDDSFFSRSRSETLGTACEEISNAELGLAEDHFAAPESSHFGLSKADELQLAIENCKRLFLESKDKPEKKKGLLKKLVELRLKLQETKDAPEEVEPDVKIILGHKFRRRNSSSTKHNCDRCCSIIWGVLQSWYTCRACGYNSHSRCLNFVIRACVALKVHEDRFYILSICPEIGLSQQNYRCAECRHPIGYGDTEEPRQCDYNGQYYCSQCHWEDHMPIPARVLLNWDWTPRKVCRASRQFLRLMEKRAVLALQNVNPMLFSFLEELDEIRRLREEILSMKRYLETCRVALNEKLLLRLAHRQHFIDSDHVDVYSMLDLRELVEDTLLPEVTKIHAAFAQHIKTDCVLCQARGYICEICDSPEILFPFDRVALLCTSCQTVLHRHCYLKRGSRCPKCERITRRRQSTLTSCSSSTTGSVTPSTPSALTPSASSSWHSSVSGSTLT